MDNKAKVVQWNCRSITNKKSDLIYLLNKYKPFICSLQETWLKKESLFRIPGYACLREDRSDGYGGVAILIKHPLTFTLIPIPSHDINFSIIAALVNKVCYVSVYIPHPSSHILNEIENILSTLPQPFLVMGDFNSQHQSWGSSTPNCYGNTMVEILDSLNICILNTGVPTRRTAP